VWLAKELDGGVMAKRKPRKPRRKKKPESRHETLPLADVLEGIEHPVGAPGQVLVSADVDIEIAPLVRVLNQAGFVTLSSCSGHGRGDASVDFAVPGLVGIRELVRRLNALDQEALPWVEMFLIWSEEIATACDFEHYPDWVMLSLMVEEPIAGDLAALAEALATAAE
jgi:hypothetical protein